MAPLHVGERLRSHVEAQYAAMGQPTRGGAERRVTTVTAEVLHDLQVQASVEGHRFVSDEPFGKGGHDAGPAPLRYFLGGIVMCHHVWIVKAAAHRGVVIDRVHGEISAYRDDHRTTDDGSRPFSRLECRVEVDAPATADEVREIVEEAAAICPALATVRLAVVVDLTVVHNGVELS